MVVDVVQNPPKSNVYEYEKKNVRSVGIYSGMMYGCVRSVDVYSGIMYGYVTYVLRVARVESVWGVRNRS